MRHRKHTSPRPPAQSPETGAVSKKLVIALNVAVLLVLAGGTAAYAGLAKTVTVDVDGRTDTVRTFGASVGSILKSREVEIDHQDKINARPSEQVSDGDTIKVRYAKPVTLAVDGKVERRTVPAATVGEVLDELDVRPAADAFLSEAEDTRLDRGHRIVVSNPKKVTVKVDGKKKTVTTARPTAAGVLEQAGVVLDADDEVSIGRDALVAKNQTLEVTRITMSHRTDKVTEEAPVEYRDDDSLEKGTEKVLEKGSDGVVRQQVLITKADGKTRHRLVLTSETVQKPVKRVIVRGTAEAPSVEDGSVWDRIAKCESGGNWSINTGNGYYGGLQFSAPTWRSVGGPGLPHEHSREVQIKYAKILQARSGWGQWSCASKVGVG